MDEFALLSLQNKKTCLLEISMECSLRGLTQNMKWASELAKSLPIETNDENLSSISSIISIDVELLREYDKYSFGKACFDCKEFSRAAYHLKNCTSLPGNFLHYYARFLEIEKNKRYRAVDLLNERPVEKADDKDWLNLKNDMSSNEDNLDAYGFYLFGMVLKKLSLDKEAIENLEYAVQMKPMLWCAWQELADMCENRECLSSLKLPKHWMSEFFHGHVEMEFHINEDALNRYTNLSLKGFENSIYIKSQIATCFYNLRDFDNSIEQFRELRSMDPYMLENVDTYSNILYIQDDRPELSCLAHHVCEIDRYRAESCGVIGNYYSLRGDHNKAVIYFKQSLRLNPEYVGAWTLLGHEYVELKNTSAAIESYRRATEVNWHDYRAWYGLGQSYELLDMPNYSLHYYRRAQSLRPNDPRLAIALGDTYKSIGRPSEAKKCYMRAIRLGDSDSQGTLKLAKLYVATTQKEDAVKLYKVYVENMEQSGSGCSEVCEACMFISRFYLQKGDHDEAAVYARKGGEYVESRDEAKTLLFEISKATQKASP